MDELATKRKRCAVLFVLSMPHLHTLLCMLGVVLHLLRALWLSEIAAGIQVHGSEG